MSSVADKNEKAQTSIIVGCSDTQRIVRTATSNPYRYVTILRYVTYLGVSENEEVAALGSLAKAAAVDRRVNVPVY